MNVSLTRELERLVEEKVESGLYQTASEVVRDALRLLKERDDLNSSRMEDLRRDIALGLKDLNEGNSITLDSKALAAIKTRGRTRLGASKRKAPR